MPEDFLGSIEFSSESDDRTPEEFIDLAHDPDILYYHIQDSKQKLNRGVEVDTDGKDDEVLVHSKVEIFQSVMQYVEAFSIYYLAYIKGREDLVKYLISTYPSEVKTFYTKLNDGEVAEYLDDHDIEADYRDLLESLFGYRFITEDADEEQLEQIDLDELSADSIEDLVEQSAEILDGQIQDIGNFYLEFENAYNAVKHGNRMIPQTDNEFQISRDGEEDVDVAVDLDFALFLCKHEGKAYLTGIPVDHLLEHSLDIAERVHDLFTYLRRIAKAAIEDEREFSVPFYGPSDGEESPQRWVKVWNPHSVLILPRTEEIAELLAESTSERTVASRLSLDGRALQIITENEDSISPEYPVMVTLAQQGVQGLTPQPLFGLNFTFTLNEIDVQQYYELLELEDLQQGEGADNTELHDKDRGEEFEVGSPTSFNIPSIYDPFERELIEQLYYLQLITGTKIPVPLEMAESHAEVIREAIEADLERDDAIEAVENLREIGQDAVVTGVYVDRVTRAGDKLESELVGSIWGAFDFGFEFESDGMAEEFEQEWGEEGDEFTIGLEGYSGSFGELVQELQEDVDDVEPFIDALSIRDDRTQPPDILVNYSIGESGFWYTEHSLRLQVIDEEAGHGPIECELCGEVTMDVQTHLTEDCEADPFA